MEMLLLPVLVLGPFILLGWVSDVSVCETNRGT